MDLKINAPVIDYVTEEVSRQGHDIAARDGIERVGWMLNAWSYALTELETGRHPSISDAIIMGKLTEPRKNARGVRKVDVRVGARKCPDQAKVLDLMRDLFDSRDSLKPLEFYLQFELIHPFVDGNGRTGKILLNWLNGSLLEPVFPPDDLFGRPIRNP